jgi:hypothetical protein
MSDYITAWSGSLERSGACPTLSRYQGASSLVGGFLREAKEPVTASGALRALGKARPGILPPHGTPLPKRALDDLILPLLKKGLTYRAIAWRFDCSENVPRRVARVHGIHRLRREEGTTRAVQA